MRKRRPAAVGHPSAAPTAEASTGRQGVIRHAAGGIHRAYGLAAHGAGAKGHRSLAELP